MKKVFTAALPALLSVLLYLLPACSQQIDPRSDDPFTGGISDTLVGTFWVWDSTWGYRTLKFESRNRALFTDDGHTPRLEVRVAYYFDEKTGKGALETYGLFTLGGDGTRLEFSNWKNYGHGSEYLYTEQGDS
ncbi:MAG: hypothetical protein LBQ35_05995 [Spirochaetaceae bacterium]|jgi:hypothetical protein|nr:hypothetical protein [Spirochaetaceae bacterium]